MIVTCGRPCGPCCCCSRRCMLLRTGCLVVACCEFFFGCAVISGSLGAAASTYINENELKSIYTDKELEYVYIAYLWQSGVAFYFIILSGITLYAYLRRNKPYLIVYMVGCTIFHVAALIGIYWSHSRIHFYYIMVPVTFLRAYFIWVIWCFWLEIKMYPEGFPPPHKPAKVEDSMELMVPNVSEASTLRIRGDG